MLASLVDKPFDRAGWLFEAKWNGYRVIAELRRGAVELYSRSHRRFNAKYAELAPSLKRIGHDVILDGELVVIGEDGKPSLELLQNYPRTREGTLRYLVFDLLFLDGHDLRDLSLVRRKETLRELLPELPNVKLSEHIRDEGEAFFKAMEAQGVEGIVAKDGQSPYREGLRTSEWIKVRSRPRQAAIIAGFTAPSGRLGPLVLGVRDKGRLVPAGVAAISSDDQETLDLLLEKLAKLVVDKSPFAEAADSGSPVTWVSPKLVCEVTFEGWTDDGRMADARFEALREDKSARNVRRENARPAARVLARPRPQAFAVVPGKKRGKGTAARKPVFELVSETPHLKALAGKKGRAGYYRALAPILVPYLHDRPLSFRRADGGIEKDFLMCQDEAALLSLVDNGCVELRPWLSRVGHVDLPDYLVLELRTGRRDFGKAVATALEARKFLGRLGAESFPKTTGAWGLELFLPLGAKYHYDQVKRFADLIAHLIGQHLSDVGAVTLDFRKNRRRGAALAPYSLRARAGAPVSTPLEWKEVARGLDPLSFTMRTIPERLERLGDIWKPVLGEGIDLRDCLDRLARVKTTG